jgi:KaiC/GvpD/RAD55 family RecA-like ATPase
MELLKTGIAGFDEFLRGGLPPRTYLLLGPPGSGNEVFARQVAFYQAELDSVSYFITSKTPKSIREDMSTFKWDVQAKEKDGKWKFVKPNPKKPLISFFSNRLRKQRCIVLDSLSELLLNFKIEEVLPLLNLMSRRSREKNALYMLLLSEGMHDEKVEATIQHFADCVITFSTTWRGEGITNNITIKKLAGSVMPTRSLPYSIGARGFTIETATRIT